MGIALFVVGAVTVVCVVNAFRPVRREPVSVVSFFVGWPTGELAAQFLFVEVVVAALLVWGGALHTALGWAGLVLAAMGALGLGALARAGFAATSVVAAAFAQATGPDLGIGPDPIRPRWGRWWWWPTRTFPVRGRQVRIVRNVDYWGDGVHRHRLDVMVPRRPAAGAPVIVYVHGGAWIVGDKREQGRPMLCELVSRGWVAVSINYRLSPKATWPEHIVDVMRALAWVKEHIGEYGGDPSFVALSGGSAGGHLCALAALAAGDPAFQPGFEDADTSVDACVPFYGVMDATGEASGSTRYGDGLVSLLERRVMKCTLAENRELFVRASPTFRVHAGAPAFFVLQGRNDTLVPVEVARTFVTALRGASTAPVAYAELPLAQHAFDILASPRCQATTLGVVRFLEAVRRSKGATRGREPGAAPASDPVA